MIKCCRCDKIKDFSEFYQRNCSRRYSYMCKQCDKMRMFKYQTTSGYWVIMLNNAKMHAKERGKKGRLDASVFNLNLEDLEAKWNLQNGKCYYSSIKMNMQKIMLLYS